MIAYRWDNRRLPARLNQSGIDFFVRQKRQPLTRALLTRLDEDVGPIASFVSIADEDGIVRVPIAHPEQSVET